jgi:6-pyruvoyltetrahydropterin/6-carboxytetrahydropterin synthase
MVYAIAQRRAFITQHILPNASGRETEFHSHPYEVEIALFGEELDENGYLVDLDEINAVMNGLIDHFQDKTLNELPEFNGLNPSLENFARIFWENYVSSINTSNLIEVRVRLWENENAYAAFEGKV